MRICFLADASHPNAQNWIRYFANYLGHEIHVISFNEPTIDLNNVHVHCLSPLFKNSKLRYILSIWKIKKLINMINPDLLIGYRVTSYGFIGACSGFHPFVIASQGRDIIPLGIQENIICLFRKYAFKKADLINSWAPSMTADLIKLGADPQKIYTLPRGVNTNLFFPVPYKEKNVKKIVTTRSLEKRYNIQQAIKAVSIVLKERPELEYNILGDGSYKTELVRLAQELDVQDKVIFRGRIEYDELPKFVAEADIYVSTIATDGVSSSLLEAMACGVFPIVIDNDANRLWIDDGINGFLIPYDDHNILAQKLKEVVCNDRLWLSAREININKIKKEASWMVNMKKIDGEYKKLFARHYG